LDAIPEEPEVEGEAETERRADARKEVQAAAEPKSKGETAREREPEPVVEPEEEEEPEGAKMSEPKGHIEERAEGRNLGRQGSKPPLPDRHGSPLVASHRQSESDGGPDEGADEPSSPAGEPARRSVRGCFEGLYPCVFTSTDPNQPCKRCLNEAVLGKEVECRKFCRPCMVTVRHVETGTWTIQNVTTHLDKGRSEEEIAKCRDIVLSPTEWLEKNPAPPPSEQFRHNLGVEHKFDEQHIATGKWVSVTLLGVGGYGRAVLVMKHNHGGVTVDRVVRKEQYIRRMYWTGLRDRCLPKEYLLQRKVSKASSRGTVPVRGVAWNVKKPGMFNIYTDYCPHGSLWDLLQMADKDDKGYCLINGLMAPPELYFNDETGDWSGEMPRFRRMPLKFRFNGVDFEYSSALARLAYQCLQYDPAARPSPSDLKQQIFSARWDNGMLPDEDWSWEELLEELKKKDDVWTLNEDISELKRKNNIADKSAQAREAA
ncbi:hypothetical protein LTR28_007295, partial [Elasticomyces elasticus]